MEKPERGEQLLETERQMAVSYGLIAAILVLGGIGFVLDRTLHTWPWLLIAGVALGFSIGFYALGSLIKKP